MESKKMSKKSYGKKQQSKHNTNECYEYLFWNCSKQF